MFPLLIFIIKYFKAELSLRRDFKFFLNFLHLSESVYYFSFLVYLISFSKISLFICIVPTSHMHPIHFWLLNPGLLYHWATFPRWPHTLIFLNFWERISLNCPIYPQTCKLLVSVPFIVIKNKVVWTFTCYFAVFLY